MTMLVNFCITHNLYASENKLNNYLKSHCVITGDLKENIRSCDAQEVKKQLGSGVGYVNIEKYISGERIVYSITPDMEERGYFYPGKIEEHSNKFSLKGNILELNIKGCIVMEKIADYNENYIEYTFLGSKGKCEKARQLAIDNLKGKVMRDNTLPINN